MTRQTFLPGEAARLLRECAVDLIRVSDLLDKEPATVQHGAAKLQRVLGDVAQVAASLRSEAIQPPHALRDPGRLRVGAHEPAGIAAR